MIDWIKWAVIVGLSVLLVAEIGIWLYAERLLREAKALSKRIREFRESLL